MSRKIFSLWLVILMCFCVVGCSGAQSNEQEMSAIMPDPITERKELLTRAYEECCDITKDYASLSYDKTSLVIDTKPEDIYYSYESDATTAIVLCNSYLKLPSAVTNKMSSTRAVDGMQSQNCGDFTVSWTYHPDNGLRVIYEVNFS